MPASVALPTFTERAAEYARAVVAGEIAACRFVKLACQRQLDDLERFAGDDAPYYFDEAKANRVCAILEHFGHVKGKWANRHERLKLEGWQLFIVCTVFGWFAHGSGMRRFRTVYIEIPRKNGKSSFSSAIGLYMLACDGEQGAHVISAANAAFQARIIFNDAQIMARREATYQARFGVQVKAHVITQESTASKFEAVSAEYSNLDGLNVHCALIDELHAHPTRGIWDILETATGARSQPLLWAITTAGTDKAGICYDQRTHVIRILDGAVEDNSYFGIIYTIDQGDDPFEESSWRKANPNYDISVNPEMLRALAARAQVMPSAAATFLGKHLNVWVNADHAWLPAGAWERLARPEMSLEDLVGETCYIGVDLATRSDFTAAVALFPPAGERDQWAVFGRYYLPEETVQRSENSHYQGWERQGRLVTNDGPTTDFEFVAEDLIDLCSRFNVLEIAQDPTRSGTFVTMLRNRGLSLPIIDVKQHTGTMSPAMKELEALVLSQRLAHDGDPILTWMISNVVCSRDAKDQLYPRKEFNDKKIDGVLALLMALDRALRGAPAIVDWDSRPGLWSV